MGELFWQSPSISKTTSEPGSLQTSGKRENEKVKFVKKLNKKLKIKQSNILVASSLQRPGRGRGRENTITYKNYITIENIEATDKTKNKSWWKKDGGKKKRMT